MVEAGKLERVHRSKLAPLQLTATTAPSIAERYVYGDPTTISLVSGMTPWIVEGPESHTRALTPPHASVYRRVCVGSNSAQTLPPNPPPAPRFIGLRFACGGGFVSGFGLGFRHTCLGPPKGETRHRVSPRSPILQGKPGVGFRALLPKF